MFFLFLRISKECRCQEYLSLPCRITHPNLPHGKEQVTLPMNFSPLSVSPVGEMQVTPLRQRLGDAGYSAPAEIGRCRVLRFGNDWEMEGTPLRQRLRDAGTDAAQLIPTTEKGSQK